MKKRGRKSAYETQIKPRFSDISDWLKSGATDKQIAFNLGIAYSTFNKYKSEKTEFAEFLKMGRQALVIEFGNDGTHAVVAQSSSVVWRWNEVAAQRVHLCQRADMARVAEVIGILATGQARAGCRLHGNDAAIRFTAEFIGDKR